MSKIILSLLFIFLSLQMQGQEEQQHRLEQRKAQIQKEIFENEKLLQATKKKEKSATKIIGIQSKKIKLKEKLINTTEIQTELLGKDMRQNQSKINKLGKDLVGLKEDYAEMIVKSYKSRSDQSRAMFLLSSDNFLQAYKRMQYMKQYTNYRKMQGEEISDKSNKLSDFNHKLNIQKTAKQKLIEENEKEKQRLEQEKKEQQKLVNEILRDKKKILVEIKKRQQETRNIDRQINKLIRAAIAEANRKSAEANRRANEANKKANPKSSGSNPTKNIPKESSTKIVLTSDGKIVSDNFRANKGRLPWPVEKGFVSLKYGNQPHPIYPRLVVHNSGVEITTDQGASARAVFAGEVTKVMVLSPLNKAVMIQHGEYFTVYQNLSSVYVSQGEKVYYKQPIGKVRTSGETGKTVIKFMISQNITYTNPATWLSGK
jgi:septal ring factor EnvC (AmiA/AmiB activator)